MKQRTEYLLITADNRLVIGELDSDDNFIIDQCTLNYVFNPKFVRIISLDSAFHRNIFQFAVDEGIGSAIAKCEEFRNTLEEMMECGFESVLDSKLKMSDMLCDLIKISQRITNA